MFPTIYNISDVLPFVKDRKEIIVADRGDHTIINYVVSTPDLFASPDEAKITSEERLARLMRHEARGLIFDKAGKLIRRPLHKFKNVNESQETQFCEIDLSQPHSILEKLDGSLISPFKLNGEVKIGTRMGLTDVASQPEAFIASHPNYIDLIEQVELLDITLNFEWLSRKQRIVIDHPTDNLVLIAARNRHSGQYMTYDWLAKIGQEFNIPVVRQFPVEGKTIEQVCNFIYNCADDVEGIVIAFDSGRRLKIKTEAYVRIHKAKDAILKERNVVDMIINEKLDDVMAMLPEEDRDELVKYQDRLLNAMNKKVTEYDTLVHKMQMTFANNKDYALSDVKKTHSRFAQRCVFQFLECRELDDVSLWRAIYDFYIKGLVRINLNNDTKFKEMKQIAFPNLSFAGVSSTVA